MSTSTVLSSVESLPPTASIEGLPRVPEHTAEEQGTSQAGLEEKNGNRKWECILKAIKNATGTSFIFPINISLIHFVFVQKSVPLYENVLPKLELTCTLLSKILVKNDKFIKFFGNHLKS